MSIPKERIEVYVRLAGEFDDMLIKENFTTNERVDMLLNLFATACIAAKISREDALKAIAGYYKIEENKGKMGEVLGGVLVTRLEDIDASH